MKCFAVSTAGMCPMDHKVHLYSRYNDMSRWSFWETGSIKDMIKFFSRNCLESLKPGERYSINHEGYNVHAIVNEDNNLFAFYAFTDKDYPRRLAYKMLEEIQFEFKKAVGESWKNMKQDDKIKVVKMEEVFHKYKDATKIDALTIANMKVEKVQGVLIDNMKQLLERQESLDAMVQKSEDLTQKTKIFYKNTDKMNSKCCTLI